MAALWLDGFEIDFADDSEGMERSNIDTISHITATVCSLVPKP